MTTYRSEKEFSEFVRQKPDPIYILGCLAISGLREWAFISTSMDEPSSHPYNWDAALWEAIP